ncbi:TonB-dependent receptor domain-containing protein [Porphyromonas levii]|uniref:TonB-dependent receptor family protein n=1 Tax=Porphyromonas levii TaxID=28114 RepID=UPI001BA5EED4|nr:Fe(3+) dicitrate transport protein FecA [Porphyromonas levii]
MKRLQLLLSLCAVAMVPHTLLAQHKTEAEPDTTYMLKDFVVVSRPLLGSKFQARHRTGSAYFLSPREIQKLGYTDVIRMLRSVPGVNMYEEDGYGLRPNISLRGTTAERSERVSIMEDGVLAAPAPYSSPAAYYFPNAARMHAVEVLKGSSQVQYGPFTTGGAINMVSTPIPQSFGGKVSLSYGSNNTLKGHVNMGNRSTHFGYLVEYLRHQSDGYRQFANGNKLGFHRNDVLAKLLFNTDRDSEGIQHALELKWGYADEYSHESYAGLTESDFGLTPYLRYPGSRMDNMKSRYTQSVATYLLEFTPNLKVTTQAYYNTFHRNWYKLNDVRVGASKGEKRGIDAVLADPETNALYYDILSGRRDYEGEALMARANNRGYKSRGIQTRVEYNFSLGSVYNNLEGAVRLHADEEDRFQWDDGYAIKGGEVSLFYPGIPGTQANRVTSAQAIAAYILNKVRWEKLTVTAGLRYEDVALLKKDYTSADLRRTGGVRIETRNSAKAIIPSLGVSYDPLKWLSLFSGVHKGFAPPSAVLYQKPESSVNIEVGTRLNTSLIKAEVIGFYNDYSNMLGSDLSAAGGQGTLEQFNVGAAVVKGVEVLVQAQLIGERHDLRLPLQFSYTYTDTEMKNEFESSSWGSVHVGDEIPYIYKHALNVQLGAEYKRVDATVSMRYNSDMRTTPGQGAIAHTECVPAHTIIDASLNWRPTDKLTISLNAINLANKVYITSRHPSGVRAGHPRGIFGGFTYHF